MTAGLLASSLGCGGRASSFTGGGGRTQGSDGTGVSGEAAGSGLGGSGGSTGAGTVAAAGTSGAAPGAAARGDGVSVSGAPGIGGVGNTPPAAGGVNGDATTEGGGDSGSSDAGGEADAGAADEVDAAGGSGGATVMDPSLAPRSLVQIVSNGPWEFGGVVGIALDAAGRIYVAHPGLIYLVDGPTVSVFLTSTEAADTAGTGLGLGFQDMDIDQNGALYSILGGSIIRVDGPHRATLWHTDPGPSSVPGYAPSTHLSVIGVDDIALSSLWAVWHVTPLSVAMPLAYPQFQSFGCGSELLAAAPSGTFLYQRGCNVDPLARGKIDGSDFGVIYTASIPGNGPMDAQQFVCSSRDPAGGFYVVVEDDQFAFRLYHLTESAHDDIGVATISTSPSFRDAYIAQLPENNLDAFNYCRIAATADGTVVLQTSAELWRMTPIP